MIKKALIGAGLLAVLGTFVFGTSIFSYARTSAKEVREAIRGEVPLEFEIKRAREMVGNLIPEMHACMRTVAEQQVDIEHMQNDIDQRTAAIDRQRTEILALRDFLGSGKLVYHTSDRRAGSYDRNEVERDLKGRFERFQQAEKAVDRDRQLLRTRQEALKANQDKLDQMIVAKEDLEVQIAELDARLQTLRAAQTASSLEFDDSQLSQAKSLIKEINKQIDVEQRLLDAEGHFSGLIPVDGAEVEPEQDVTEQIDSYFGVEPELKSADVSELDPAA